MNILYREIMREYEISRDASIRAANARKEGVYKRIPRIEEIDEELALIGLHISKAILHEPENALFLTEALNKKVNEMVREKEMLLLENHYDANYLEVLYQCSLCKDTGYVGRKKCACFSRKFIEKSYHFSNLKDILLAENFDHFKIDYYSDTVDTKEKISPRKNMENIFQSCWRFIKNFDKKFENLLLYGKSGLGKTFVCHAIAKELLDKGRIVLYITSFYLFKMIEDERFNKNEEEEVPKFFLDNILEVDLLIIDDLGTEFSTSLTNAELFNIINARLLSKKQTIISTNLSPADLKDMYSDRIVSRILGSYNLLKFFGDDLRILKKYKSLR